MPRFLITGPTGYLGSHVVAALRAKGAEITAITRSNDDGGRIEGGGVTKHVVALDDAEALAALAARCDGAAHLAASELPGFLPVSQAAIDALHDGLPDGAPLIMQGGSMVFGPTGPIPVRPETFAPPPPLKPVADLQRHLLSLNSSLRRSHVIYAALVHGGRGAMIPNMWVEASTRLGFVPIIGAGESVWSLVHVKDWAELVALTLLAGPGQGGALFAAAELCSIAQFATALSAAFAPELKVRALHSEDAESVFGFFAAGMQVNQCFDGSLERDRYGWRPPIRSLRDSFAELQAIASRRTTK